jgi:hypothetical protein
MARSQPPQMKVAEFVATPLMVALSTFLAA